MEKHISKINNTFSDRLKNRSKELGYSTESKLLDRIQKEHPDFSSATVHSWWSYVSLPGLENLAMLARILDCDINYLLGVKNETTFERYHIRKETGLSDDAIRTLQNAFDVTSGALLKVSYKPLSVAVSYLLTTEHGLNLLQHIYDYINSGEISMQYQGNPVLEDIIVSNAHTQNTYSLSPSDYDALLLTQIQRDLVLLKNSNPNEKL